MSKKYTSTTDNSRIKKALPFFFILATIFMAVGYASVNSVLLDINGTVAIASTDGVFITQAEYKENFNANLESSSIEDFYQTMLKTTVSLSDTDPDSSITYTVTIYNKKNRDVEFIECIHSNNEEFYNNNDITYELTGLAPGDVLESRSYVTFDITFKYVDDVIITNTDLTSYLNFIFKDRYDITYFEFTETNYPEIALGGDNFVLEFTDEVVPKVQIFMDDEILQINDDYTYENNILTIFDVTGDLMIIKRYNTLGEQIHLDNQISPNCPTRVSDTLYYSIIGQDDRTMFCGAKDNFGDTYYYRGETLNNYVYYANELWRIVRINGDGTVRITLADPVGSTHYSKRGHNKYVGYMYRDTVTDDYFGTHLTFGNTGDILYDSEQKGAIDTWYSENIKDQYDNYLSDNYFCNSRSVFDERYVPPYDDNINYTGDLRLLHDELVTYGWGTDTGLGYGLNRTYYGTWYRLVQATEIAHAEAEQYASFSCYHQNDRFTVNNDIGNQALVFPVGALTADELVFSGITYSDITKNKKNSLDTDIRYWTMSPSVVYGSTAAVIACTYLPDGWLSCGTSAAGTSANPNANLYAFRPVVNLKANIITTEGSGTLESPYQISVDPTELVNSSSIYKNDYDYSSYAPNYEPSSENNG